MASRANFGRVLAEFWADGLDSETPPGHWNTIANLLADDPDVERKLLERRNSPTLSVGMSMYILQSMVRCTMQPLEPGD